MTVYDLISKWLKEAVSEWNQAQKDQNYLKMLEIKILIDKLREIRDGN